MAMKIQDMVFEIMTPCSDVVGYRRFGFGGPCCLYLQSEVPLIMSRFHVCVVYCFVIISQIRLHTK